MSFPLQWFYAGCFLRQSTTSTGYLLKAGAKANNLWHKKWLIHLLRKQWTVIGATKAWIWGICLAHGLCRTHKSLCTPNATDDALRCANRVCLHWKSQRSNVHKQRLVSYKVMHVQCTKRQWNGLATVCTVYIISTSMMDTHLYSIFSKDVSSAEGYFHYNVSG